MREDYIVVDMREGLPYIVEHYDTKEQAEKKRKQYQKEWPYEVRVFKSTNYMQAI